jgi:hypothetical protein
MATCAVVANLPEGQSRDLPIAGALQQHGERHEPAHRRTEPFQAAGRVANCLVHRPQPSPRRAEPVHAVGGATTGLGDHPEPSPRCTKPAPAVDCDEEDAWMVVTRRTAVRCRFKPSG